MNLASRFLARTPLRRKRTTTRYILAAEVLEDRQLLSATIVEPNDGLDLVARDRWGNWWASTPGAEQRIFASWTPYADWQHVLSGDFDGDSFTDIVGWDPGTGQWWASLADPIGSTTLVATVWSKITTWSDVSVVELNKDGVGNDLIGRDQWGNWWAAIANGDGTFHNTLLTNWSAAVEWRDVTTFDLNRDGTTDIVGRTSDGNWWAAIRHTDGTYHNRFLASWDESAGWQDATLLNGYHDPTDGPHGDWRSILVARSSWGAWWALSSRQDGSIETRYLATWDESLGWRDVLAANVIDNYNTPAPENGVGHEIVGRTSNGDWYALDPRTLTTTLVGHWNEDAGWSDVHVINLPSMWFGFRLYDDTIIGRTADGVWWGSNRAGEDPGGNRPTNLINKKLATWRRDAGWSDGFSTGRLGNKLFDVTVLDAGVLGRLASGIDIYAHRAGTSVTFIDISPPPDPIDETAGGTISMTYSVPSLGFEKMVAVSMPRALTHQIVVEGRSGDDVVVSRSRFNGLVKGRAGDDFFDAKNGHGDDVLLGGDGNDGLDGDAGDRLVQ